MAQPILMIHGGAGSKTPNKERAKEIHESLFEILQKSYEVLKKKSARDAVIVATEMFEDNPLFNAGKGSAIQQDGVARLSAALMDGYNGRFSGVCNVKGVKNPIRLAEILASEKNRVLSGAEARKYAIEQGLELGSPYTKKTRKIWQETVKPHLYDTVGAVAIDQKGHLAAATSTGGMMGAKPGRLSDSMTVAGNYANRFAAVSVTGVGEEIVEQAVAAKIVTRVTDGFTLKEAFQKTFREARTHSAQLGCIAISKKGEFFAQTNTDFMSWAVQSGNKTLKVVP